MTQAADWEKLLSGLSQRWQRGFERTLRQSLKRRLHQVENLDTSLTPDSVRSQAVCAWRKRYMKGASKSAKKRMNYARLHNDPTYVEIERELSVQYWESQACLRQLPNPDEVESLTVAEACEAFKATCPKLGGTELDALLRDMLSQTYTEINAGDAVREQMERRVRDTVRTRRLKGLLHGGPTASVLHLADANDEQEVVRRVGNAHLAEAVLCSTYGNRSVYLAACDTIVAAVRKHRHAVAIHALYKELFGLEDPTRITLRRLAKKDARRIESYLRSESFSQLLASDLLRNPRYGNEYWQAMELRLRVRENVPQTPMEAFPLARAMTRHFTLHVGPTNSGKTHDAVQALAAASSGAYLGPLRLLAFEQFETLNHMGCVCSLLTGEEAMELAGSHHVSSTVEMANFHTPIDVGVIDEAQMIADKSRGHRWAEAILGIPAHEVHVCCAPHAEQVVSELVRLCDDELTVVRHNRLVPLLPEKRGFRLPESVRPGDALVVFSRKSVHAVAAQVAGLGMRPSVIYGALPYEVRHEEARRFNEGETDVVVATDAIGMGMNLPIRRVVFVEQEKFDGCDVRMLRPEEVQQIAGRAGRFGRYDKGYVTSVRLRGEIRRRITEPVPVIESVPVGIPEGIAYVRDATLSDCIRQWMALEQPVPFYRIGIARDLALIQEVEAKLPKGRRKETADKQLVLSLATMAFDERDKDLYRTWQRMADAELAGEELELAVPPEPEPGIRLEVLERQYRYCDLLYTYARAFGHSQRLEELVLRRDQISHAIMGVLAS